MTEVVKMADIKSFVNRYRSLDTDRQDAVEAMREDMKAFVKDRGLNTQALKLAIRLSKMDAAKQADFMNTLELANEALGICAQKEMFDD